MYSRRRQLINTLENADKTWTTGLVMLNIPSIMLDNDFIRSICLLANASLMNAFEANQQALHQLDISANK